MAGTGNPWLASVRLLWRTLTFRSSVEEYEDATWHAYVVGFALVWLAGIGRTWDDLEASLVRKLGLGSLVYVVVLAGLVAIFALPLARKRLAYQHILLFVTMTALPALIYAIPIERWTDMATAQVLNLQFLLFVAAYRVALFFRFLFACMRIAWFDTLLSGLLPLMLIIVVIVLSGATNMVLDVMGGLRGRDPQADDLANDVVLALTGFSCLAFIPAFLVFCIRAYAVKNAPVSSDE